MVNFSKYLNWLPAALGLGVAFPGLVLPAAATGTAIGLKALANRKARRIELDILDRIEYGPWQRIRQAAYSLEKDIKFANADTFVAMDPFYFNYRATQTIQHEGETYLFVGYRLCPLRLEVSRVHPVSNELMDNAVFLKWIGKGRFPDDRTVLFESHWIEELPVGQFRPWRMPQHGDFRRFLIDPNPSKVTGITPVDAGFPGLVGKSMFAGHEGLPSTFIDMYGSPENQFEADLLRHAIHHGLVRS